MAWAKAGPGRPKDDTKTRLAKRAALTASERIRKQSLRLAGTAAGYDPKFLPFEVVQRALDGAKLPDGQEITEYHLARANELLPYTMPKLQAVAIVQPPPPTPRADLALRGASLEALEMLRDALALCLDEAGRQIEGQLAAPDGDS